MYQSVFGSAASRVATFVCFCHETLFCIFVPPRLPFPALHLSSQAPRCFSPLLETVTFSVDLSQTSSPPGVCGTFLNVNPKSQTLLQFLLTCHVSFPSFAHLFSSVCLFSLAVITPPLFSPVSSPAQPSVDLSYMKASDRRRFSLFEGDFHCL